MADANSILRVNQPHKPWLNLGWVSFVPHLQYLCHPLRSAGVCLVLLCSSACKNQSQEHTKHIETNMGVDVNGGPLADVMYVGIHVLQPHLRSLIRHCWQYTGDMVPQNCGHSHPHWCEADVLSILIHCNVFFGLIRSTLLASGTPKQLAHILTKNGLLISMFDG